MQLFLFIISVYREVGVLVTMKGNVKFQLELCLKLSQVICRPWKLPQQSQLFANNCSFSCAFGDDSFIVVNLHFLLWLPSLSSSSKCSFLYFRDYDSWLVFQLPLAASYKLGSVVKSGFAWVCPPMQSLPPLSLSSLFPCQRLVSSRVPGCLYRAET